jgi:hypothetical protein
VNSPTQKDLRDVAATRLDDLEQFFVTYNRLQGRRFIPERRDGARAAYRALRQGMN